MLLFRSAATFIYFSIIIALFVLNGCGRIEYTEPVISNEAPLVPIGLTIRDAFDGMIGLSWSKNSQADISGYDVYSSVITDTNFVKIGFTSNNYYDDFGLEYNSVYYYAIKAVNNSGLQSDLSSAVSAIPKNRYAPIEPYVVKINARNIGDTLQIFLSWSPSIDKDIAYYEIYRDTVEFVEHIREKNIGTTDKTNFVDKTNLKIGTKYFYKIRAYDKGGLRSPLTEIVSDYILDKPGLIYPPDKSEINTIENFRIKTVNGEAKYKLIIQNSAVGGIIKEIDFEANASANEHFIDVRGLLLEGYKTYFWRVATFTNNNTAPNSYSNLYSFYYNPQ
jgi:fibronectin type 3 domain-containing protein